MPVSRKAPQTIVATRPVPERSRDRLPRRIVVFVVLRDESGSMGRWRQRQGEFIPAIAAHLMEVGGPKVGDIVFVAYFVVSGTTVVTTEFMPLGRAADPEFAPDGQTPIGTALAAVADKVAEFFESRVFPEEVTPRNFEVLIVSDLKATGESEEETRAGVEKFVAMATKYRAKVNLVGPSPEAMDEELAARLDVSGRGIKYLDSDPKSVLDITFDSILSASRTSLGRSDPAIRIR